MADDTRHDSEEPDTSLELPSLRSAFRRRPRGRPPKHAESAHDDSAILTAEEDAAPRERRRIRFHVPGLVAAALTGAVVGLAMVGLAAAGLQGCSSMRGTSSCGKPGILLLLVITAAVILLGSLLLRLAGVATHGSTSFLGVALLVVLILLALLPVLDSWWVVIVVPVLGMVTYAASWWLTTSYADPGERPR
jgi:hypothetical protein